MRCFYISFSSFCTFAFSQYDEKLLKWRKLPLGDTFSVIGDRMVKDAKQGRLMGEGKRGRRLQRWQTS